MRFVGVVLGCGVLLQGLMAQAPVERRSPQNQDKDQVPTLRLESRLVNLPLNVVDEKGVPVAGLDRDDFEILEDGKLQKIAIFEKEAVARCRLCCRSMLARACCGMNGWRRMRRSIFCAR